MRYLLDTSIISAPVAREPNALVIKQLELMSHECGIAAPVWHELMYGCLRLAKGARRNILSSYLEEVVQVSFPVLPYDAAAAEWHARERARLDSIGLPAPQVDAQIAAIARVNQLILVTANTKDFANYEGLATENWSVARRKGR